MTYSLKTLIPAAIPLILYSLSLSGCQDRLAKEATQDTVFIDVASDIQVSATTDFENPGHIVAATFVPNLVAGWATQLVLMNEDGALSRTQMDRPAPQIFAPGPYKDIQGYGRNMAAGVLIALTEDGSIGAFIEVSDKGDFKALPVSAPTLKVSQFCASSDFTAPRLVVETQAGALEAFSIVVENEAQLTLSRLNETVETECDAKSLAFGGESAGTLSTNPTGPHLLYTTSGAKSVIEIKDGLSIRGIKNPDVLLLTDRNLGSAFTNGALVVTDTDSNRVVLIAQDFLRDEIASR